MVVYAHGKALNRVKLNSDSNVMITTNVSVSYVREHKHIMIMLSFSLFLKKNTIRAVENPF